MRLAPSAYLRGIQTLTNAGAISLQEENLRSGLLLEQGALCLLRTRPPKLRKFAFHMTLAGLRFNACDQKALGARAYRYVTAEPCLGNQASSYDMLPGMHT